ncbi:rhomboid family intramembrane serine protease [Muriicola sp.]|uniref:rhomboid family intramembrane serine protease n=1 Tax=Muriicola sp. TaxID=2020856 RepID=UPI00356512CE
MSKIRVDREEANFRFTDSVLFVPMVAVLLIWTVFWLELQFRINWNDYGIFPRTVSGLRGVILSPFLHSSVEHLYNNSIPLVILLGTLMYFYRSIAFKLLFWGLILTGLVTWLIGRPAYHIGASGLIYLLASFIFFKGIFTKHYRLVAVSLVVSFIYGSMLWYIFPVEEGISWEGHLGGFLVGLFAALFLKVRVPLVPKYAWEREDYNEEEDEFLKHFDEEGNFIENISEDEDSQVRITYTYRKNRQDPSAEGD